MAAKFQLVKFATGGGENVCGSADSRENNNFDYRFMHNFNGFMNPVVQFMQWTADFCCFYTRFWILPIILFTLWVYRSLFFRVLLQTAPSYVCKCL